MLIAETVEVDGGIVALFLAIAAVILLLALTIVIGGSVAAFRAGRGSRTALNVWIGALAIESLAFLQSIREFVNQISIGLLVIIGFQVLLYFDGKRDRK